MTGEYLLVLAAMLAIPLVVSFNRRLHIYTHTRALAFAILIPLAIFGTWDVIATRRGHWHFNQDYVLGWNFLGLPFEEWLFFIVLSFVSIVTWEAINRLIRKRR